MDEMAFDAFLVSQKAGFESFLAKCEDISLDEVRKMLSKHCKELQRVLDNYPQLGETKDNRMPSTPRLNSRQLRAIPTHTPAGKALSVAGAGTLFKTGSGTKRRAPPPDSDSSPEAAEVNTIQNNASPVSQSAKKRLVSVSKSKKATNKDANDQDAGEKGKHSNEALAAMNSKPPARRRGSGQKIVMNNPFISN